MKKLKFEWFLPALAALIVFLPTLGTYFSQDDWVFLSHVYKQPFLSVFKHYPEAFYRPVGQQLFFFLGSRMFGLEAQGFHLVGLAIHLLNIWLLSKLMNIRGYPSTRTPRGWLRGMKGLGNGAFGAGFRPDRLEDTPQSAAGRPHNRRVKYFLLAFYAVNPAHFVALNWLTQVDLEIAVSFALLTILFWKRTIFSLGLFLAALLSHETVVMLPIAMLAWIFKGQSLRTQGLSLLKPLLKPAMFFCFGILVLIVKYLINPFSIQSDYSLNFNLFGLLSTLKWYTLRALMIPEGIRNLPVWLMDLSLIPGLIFILMFRQRLIRGLGIYLLGVLPVLGFGGHLLAAYAIFGIALMVIELGRNGIAASSRRDVGTPRNDRTKIETGFWVLSMSVIILSSAAFVYSNYLNHWSTGRGVISAQLTREYIMADSNERNEILSKSKDFVNNPEIYFSSMMGKQFEVLDRGVGRGLFDVLFYRGNDLTTQFLPDAEFFRDSILTGKFPAWNPWIMAGMPYFLDPQNFLWYPPNYFFLLMPVEIGFLILLVGHLVLAGWGVKKILGNFGYLGYLAAAIFVLSPKLVGHIEEGNWTLVIAACWLPALYLALKKNKFWWTVISLAAIIINNLNIGYYSILFVILFLLFLKRSDLAAARLPASPELQRGEPAWQARSDLKMIKIFIVTAILTIPRWLPLALFGNQTVRAGLNEPPLPLWSWTKIAKSLFFPLVSGHPVLQNEEILYLGLAPILLVLLGILGKLGKMGFRKGVSLLRQGDSLFWSIWLVFIFFLALNNKTPLFYLINRLPGFSLLRITTRPWIFAGLAVALAAPVAIRKIGEIRDIRGFRINRKIARISELVLSIVILAEFAWFGWKIFERREIAADPVPTRFYRQMATAEIPVRAYCTTGCLDRLTAQRMGIALLGGNNPIQLKSFVEYLQMAGGYKERGYHPILPPYTVFNQQPQPDAEMFGQTSTKFVVSPYELTDENFKLVDRQGDFRLYQNTAESQDMKDHYFGLETIKML